MWEIPKSCIDKDPAKQLCENLKFSGSVRKCVDKDATTCTCEDTVPDESAELGYITIEKSLNLEKESGDFCVAADGKSAVIRHFRELDAYEADTRAGRWTFRKPRERSQFPVGVLGLEGRGLAAA